MPTRTVKPGETRGRTRKPRPEKAIQRAILDFLATVPGVYAFKTGTGMFPMTYKGKTRMVRMGKVGVADIVGWRITGQAQIFAPVGSRVEVRAAPSIARFLAVEVKRPGSLATPEQCVFLERVRQAGGISITATCVDDVRKGLGL